MKFTVNTKPFKNALSLAVVDSNVVKYYMKSTIVQITASIDRLRVNTEASSIITEVSIYGDGDCDASVLLDAILLKKLISTIDSSQLDIEFNGNSVCIVTSDGRYNLPVLGDTNESSLRRPISVDESAVAVEVKVEDWKFIKSYQMYARSEFDGYPAYTQVYVGDSGDILVGCQKRSLFTHSSCNVFGTIGSTCLISESVVNMLNAVPDNATISRVGNQYVISAQTDAFEYTTQFEPKYESDEFGYYMADTIIDMMKTFDTPHISVLTTDVLNILNRVSILSKRLTKLHVKVDNSGITFSNNDMKSTINVSDSPDTHYEIDMNPDMLRNVISHCPEVNIRIYPAKREGELVGIVITSGKLSVILAGVE